MSFIHKIKIKKKQNIYIILSFFLALPDGSHNYDRDTIYFHLPHPKNTHRTIFGISCYRQISAEQLKEKDEDVTRGTVQKSVVVLSELPLYGMCNTHCVN